MFETLIVSALKREPQTTPELYEKAHKYQPQDCSRASCTHRKKISDFEWQHQLRREQQYLKKQGIIELRSGRGSSNKQRFDDHYCSSVDQPERQKARREVSPP